MLEAMQVKPQDIVMFTMQIMLTRKYLECMDKLQKETSDMSGKLADKLREDLAELFDQFEKNIDHLLGD
jgi:hypothetical protein